MFNRYFQRLRSKLRTYTNLYLRNATPVVVYQMGKVGSSSIENSLMRALERPVFHVHMMNPENIKRHFNNLLHQRNPIPDHLITGKLLHKAIITRNREAKFITSVREPIARNISAFFQNISILAPEISNSEWLSVDELTSIFLQRYPHTVPLNWFDREIAQTLRIDVYAHSFPKEKGYMQLSNGNFDLLILKSELDDRAKEREIASFLDLSSFSLRRYNVAAEKSYAEMYQSFVRNIQLPTFYINAMCDAKFTRHFYTDSEINRMRTRWTYKQ